MLKIVAIGNLTNDVELKVHEATGKPYAILRIASDRRYRDKEGNRLTDFISIKVRGPLAVCKAVATVDGRKIVTAELTSMLGDAPAAVESGAEKE